MDIGLVVRAIAEQFMDLESPFGRAKAAALAVTLLLAFARGLLERRVPGDGLRGWDAILVGMLTNLISYNAMMPIFGGLGMAIQSGLGIDLSGSSAASRLVGLMVLTLILVLVASLALGCVVLLRGLGRRIARPSRDIEVRTGWPGA